MAVLEAFYADVACHPVIRLGPRGHFVDTSGDGVSPGHGGTGIGLGGRYGMCVAGRGNGNSPNPITNGGFAAGWIGGTAANTTNTPTPCPQPPFKVAVCLSYGTFATAAGATIPGTVQTNQGGPVGPDGSSLNRHSTRW